MTDQSRLGGTTPRSVELTPELPLGTCSDSRGAELQTLSSGPAGLGKTETPVHVLPGLEFDMQPLRPSIYRGTVSGGVVVLEETTALPDGTEVCVVVAANGNEGEVRRLKPKTASTGDD
jgi:hypothetical protein